MMMMTFWYIFATYGTIFFKMKSLSLIYFSKMRFLKLFAK